MTTPKCKDCGSYEVRYKLAATEYWKFDLDENGNPDLTELVETYTGQHEGYYCEDCNKNVEVESEERES